MTSFADFIRSDNFISFQRAKITKLALASEKLQSFEIQSKPDLSSGVGFYKSFSLNQPETNLSYKIEKLRLQIIDEVVHDVVFKRLGSKGRESKRLHWLIVLAMLDKKQSNIVKMLAGIDLNTDIPIFQLKHMPSLHYFSCIIKCDRLLKNSVLKNYWMNIPISVLYGEIKQGDVLYVSSTTQLKHFNELVKVYKMIDRKENNPFFEIYELNRVTSVPKYEVPILFGDLYCIYNTVDAAKRFIAKYRNIMKQSKMIYFLNCNTELILELQTYDINAFHFYCNLSPLHIAAYYGNLEVLAMYIEISFNPNKQDYNGNTPMHFAAMMGNKACYDLMCHKTHLNICRFSYNKGDEYKLNNRGKSPIELLKTNSNNNVNNYDLVKTISDLKRARVHAKIFRDPRFKLVTFEISYFDYYNNIVKKRVDKLGTIWADDYQASFPTKHYYDVFHKIFFDEK